MSWYRQMIFGQDPEEPKLKSRRGWIKITAIVLLFGLAWYFGIVTSVYNLLKVLAVAIWEMLADVFRACRDFVQYILRMAGH